ncbi:MAG TPA: SGNH/GDSL hydrolase family protein [Tepidisphaeraceae bacterium]|nr:SGNH/GDSL hydrolase family protein [Tepidisphaeraceae bacterium]
MSNINRRDLLTSIAAVATSTILSSDTLLAQTTSPATTSPAPLPEGLLWHNIQDSGVEGRAFPDTAQFFHRLPARAKSIVRDPIWRLSTETAGMSARFETDSPSLYLKLELLYSSLAAPHMSATSKSGLDLYAHDDNSWRWIATHSPASTTYTGPLVTTLKPGLRQYQLNLPIYNGVKSLQIGIPNTQSLRPLPPRTQKPILFYGTSVTQGACASRPGMTFLSILSRRLDRPFLNFGFSGNGLFEIEVGRFLSELDPAIFVLDCVGNSTVDQINQRVEPLVQLLRHDHPQTSILLLERAPFSNAGLVDQGPASAEPKNAALKNAYDRLLAAGTPHLHYRDNKNLLGTDSDGTIDGSHATDLGMTRYANALEPDLRQILG